MYAILIAIGFCLFLPGFAIGQQSSPPSQPAKSTNTATAPDNKIYAHPTIGAQFLTGDNGLKKYIEDNLDTSVPTVNKAPAGRYTVVIRCIVSFWGSASDVMAETKHGYGMEAEAVALMKKIPRWKPAFHAGRAVNSFFRQEITFVVP